MTDIAQRIAGLTPEARAALARRLAAKEGARAAAPPIPRGEERPSYPLSASQRQFWLLDRLAPGLATYNVPFALRLTGPLDGGKLERALGAIVRRHAPLRARFALEGDEPVQLVAREVTIPLPLVAVAGRSLAEREAAAWALARAEAARPFDLASGPLLRATALRLGPTDHLLVLILHHIVADGWSIDLLIGELAARYAAFVDGTPDPLPPLPIAYGDYVLWQRASEDGAALAAQRDFWRERLRGAPPTLDLPTDRPRPPLASHDGALHRDILPPDLSAGVRALARRAGATPFMVLLAAFKVLLARYTGRDDLLVGTPVAGRGRTELEGLIGTLVNTVVLRTDLAGDPSFAEALRRVREATLGADANGDLPFARLVEELQPVRVPGHAPLFQVLVGQDAHTRSFAGGGLAFGPAATLGNGTAKFDLSLYVGDDPAGTRVTFEYSTALFDAATIARLAGHYRTLLAGIVADPERPIGALPLLPDDERRRLLTEWNDTRADLPQPATLPGLFEATVAELPNAVAVLCGDERLSYRELNARANQLARHLRARGVGPGTLVGLCVERSPAMVVALLGVLKAGGAYVPLDPAYPAERLGYMLDDARVPILLTQEGLLPALPPTDAAIVRLDADWPLIARESEGNLPGMAGEDDLAYVIYTSGSTGRPKGVQITGRALVNLLTSMRRTPGLGRDDTLLAVTTLSFDIAALEIFLPLIAGARLVLAPRATAADGARLLALLDECRATVLQATPATWRMLLAAGWGRTPGLTAFCGGEALPRDLAEAILARAGALWNLYGPTETTIWSLARRVGPGDGPPPIGGPLANTRIYLLDRRLQPVPIGVPGELCIGGAGVARGYLGRPDLTAERFIPDPFTDAPGARLYRTGDLARYRADGSIEFLGRMDGQIKLRGFRIEPGEIEAALARHPAIREVVVAKEDGADPRLVAWIVARAGASLPAARELRAFLKGSLPEYMLPAAFAPIDALPLTPNGKVDRRALPALAGGRTERGGYAPPGTALEGLLAGIWAEVLGLERVGIHDHYFAELGGQSLQATQLLARMRAALGADLPLRSLFEAPTVAQFARVVESYRAAESAPAGAPVPIARRETTDADLAGLPEAELDALLARLLDPKEAR